MTHETPPPSYNDVMLQMFHDHSVFLHQENLSPRTINSTSSSEIKNVRRRGTFIILACLIISVILCLILILHIFNVRYGGTKP
ncbi:protein U24 [Human betaherpesvirus 7]|uniref:U24 protein n=3 Tax=Human betaherpesvirus 7 TaxID=10372 RepID=U24_HHV7J|nr:protein U24 [Human betaherpesvirus 7]Q69505.1 RecName: Full=U24 protein [Human herpesvirus 7 strain JI]AAC40737.1 U24 [Human betaherpesvirus 7]AAC54685.1 U24 [Human betaherpesvirus 7]AGV28647.1 U24 [Human betaherpesvirus 7]UQK62761.1 U24 [Human betaherpesvirus 7]UQK62839.1 U24 [Human betaherpesvirus 7]